jgi:hypothetical protein
MSGFIKMRMWQRAALVTAGVLLLSNSIYAQDGPWQKSASRTSGKFLDFNLKVLTPTSCMGSPLKLRLEVTNAGQETVRLNRAYFWNNSVQYPSQEVLGEGEERFMNHVWPRSTSEDVFLLAPGATHVTHSYWSPYQGSGPGHYTLEISGYGKLNKVQFELKDCKLKGN